jgi:hypothetical protein
MDCGTLISFGYCGSDDCPELAWPVCLTGLQLLQLLPMRRREPFKIVRGEIQRGRGSSASRTR